MWWQVFCVTRCDVQNEERCFIFGTGRGAWQQHLFGCSWFTRFQCCHYYLIGQHLRWYNELFFKKRNKVERKWMEYFSQKSLFQRKHGTFRISPKGKIQFLLRLLFERSKWNPWFAWASGNNRSKGREIRKISTRHGLRNTRKMESFLFWRENGRFCGAEMR